MALDEILQDLLSKSQQLPSSDPGGASHSDTTAQNVLQQDEFASLLTVFESECNNRYQDPGPGLHFVGILLAVFAAEVISAHWAKKENARGTTITSAQGSRPPEDNRGRPPKLLSCLYSSDAIAFVLSHPPEHHIHSSNVVRARWQGHPQATGKVFDTLDEKNSIYSVSAAIQSPNGTRPGDLQEMPFFSCPRKYIDLTNSPGPVDVGYINERFEETDLLPPLSMALGAHSLQESMEVILRAHSPRDTAMPIDDSFDENTFFRQQFTRGCGVQINWLDDPALIRNTKLEFDNNQSLASSKIVGVFGTPIQPRILFLRHHQIGLYNPLTRSPSMLSHNSDFFEAGIEYSSKLSPLDVIATEPSQPEEMGSPQTTDLPPPEQLSSILHLPPNVNLFSFQESTPRTPTTAEIPPNDIPESPSFFSPSFADHLSSSRHTRPDPRIHTANIPLKLTSPIRSQTYPSTPSPVRAGPIPPPQLNYNSISRSQASSRLAARRPSDIPPPKITPVTPSELSVLLDNRDMLVIDIRAFAAYAKGRLVDSINVCIPTVLLKRPSLSLDDISESIVSRGDRGRFARWKEADGIVIYDADSLRVKDAYPLATLAIKFAEAGFDRVTYGLTGGFAALSDTPSLIDTTPLTNIKSPTPPNGAKFPSAMTVRPSGADATTLLALECKESPLFARDNPTQASGTTAFFSNIRQNMDLHGGVGPVIPIKAPSIPDDVKAQLPQWLVNVAYASGGPELLASQWETIEVTEKKRLESILSNSGMKGRFSISAAMEQGGKNRYTNIWPFEWNRVKVPWAEANKDYFNGSLIKEVIPGVVGRRYIATQAPLPSTFEDFWKVIWGEEINIIVTLTATEERGQVKCHPYWRQGIFGAMHVTPVSSENVSMGANQTITIRTLMLRNRAEPFAAMREIVQVHYEGWPDFGTPAEPACIVALVNLVNDLASQRGKLEDVPLLVHCSAGCGRTGTYCTVDSMMQYLDSTGDRGTEDVIYRTVLGLRKQRMSLVQTLRQYVLCYECVLHHLLGRITENNQMNVE